MPRRMALIGDLHRSDARFLFATWKQLDWQPRSDDEHRAILTAIERGQSERARHLLESHVREAGRALVERIRAADDQVHAAQARSKRNVAEDEQPCSDGMKQ